MPQEKNQTLQSIQRCMIFCSMLPLLMGCIVPLSGHDYYTPPLSGRVTDSVTRLPLAGVYIYAQERNAEGDAVTDADGRYTLAPLRSPQAFKILAPTGGMFYASVSFKTPGYEPHREQFQYMFAGQHVDDIKRARVLDVALSPLP